VNHGKGDKIYVYEKQTLLIFTKLGTKVIIILDSVTSLTH